MIQIYVIHEGNRTFNGLLSIRATVEIHPIGTVDSKLAWRDEGKFPTSSVLWSRDVTRDFAARLLNAHSPIQDLLKNKSYDRCKLSGKNDSEMGFCSVPQCRF